MTGKKRRNKGRRNERGTAYDQTQTKSDEVGQKLESPRLEVEPVAQTVDEVNADKVHHQLESEKKQDAVASKSCPTQLPSSESDHSVSTEPSVRPCNQQGVAPGIQTTAELTTSVEEADTEKSYMLPSKELFSPPKRPEIGTVGKRIRLRANFFQIKLPDGNLHHYDVTVAPSCARPICREVIKELVKQYAKIFNTERPVFDGRKNMYARHPLPIGQEKKDFTVRYKMVDGKTMDFKVSIKKVAEVSIIALEEALKGRAEIPYESIQALDVVMRHLPSFTYVPVGRSFFSPPDPRSPDYINLGCGRETWFGFHQSLRPSQWKMLLNVDVSATAFYKTQPVISFLADVVGGERTLKNQLQDNVRVKFKKEIKGLKVEITHLGSQKRKYRVTDVTQLPASKQTFPFKEEGKAEIRMTVAEYFRKQYRIDLRYGHLPCLQVGDKSKHVFLPLEVCNVVAGQRCTKKLTDAQTKQMIKATARDAVARENEIVKLVTKADYKNDCYVKGFGIEVGTKEVELEGRILPPPKVQYKDKNDTMRENFVTPKYGKWDLRNSKFYACNDIRNWGIAVCCSPSKLSDVDLRKFVGALWRSGNEVGMKFNREPCFCHYINNARPDNVEGFFKKHLETYPELQLMLFILLPGAKDLYAKIKAVGDLLTGVPTQVVLIGNVQEARQQTLTNICLKINAKLGGTNNVISNESRPAVLQQPVIFLGADVTHPAPGDDKKPSIAAVVGSLDPSASKYCASVRVQKHRQEIISDLKQMTKQLLISFRNQTKRKPVRIIMFRDGVSEGQFQQVLQHELVAIRQACTELEEAYKPGITFIVVQKRHHCRFFPQDPRDACGKSRNIPAGTCVDTVVCHPSEYDFYLCSHAGIQGTSRPSHYHVLWDDNNISPDELQKLTNLLCHVFVRCTRAVSIPAPAYYAHLVAFRARHHLLDTDRDSTDSSGSQTSRRDSENGAAESVAMNLASLVKPHEKMALRMYFV